MTSETPACRAKPATLPPSATPAPLHQVRTPRRVGKRVVARDTIDTIRCGKVLEGRVGPGLGQLRAEGLVRRAAYLNILPDGRVAAGRGWVNGGGGALSPDRAGVPPALWGRGVFHRPSQVYGVEHGLIPCRPGHRHPRMRAAFLGPRVHGGAAGADPGGAQAPTPVSDAEPIRKGGTTMKPALESTPRSSMVLPPPGEPQGVISYSRELDRMVAQVTPRLNTGPATREAPGRAAGRQPQQAGERVTFFLD